MAKLSPIFNEAQFINGISANGAKLFTYVAGSSTKQTTYTDEAGLVAQANPIVLNSRGEPTSPIWLTEGLSYKFVFTASTDTDPPASPIRTIDNIEGINDSTTTIDQWVQSGLAPTFVSATQFTLPGDQTSAFHVNRRVKLLVTAGTVYGYISVTAFAALTTVTVVLDSGALDSGLSNVQLGLITYDNTSLFPMQTANIADSSITNAKLANAYINDLTSVNFDYGADSVAIADASDSGNKKKALLSASKIVPITASVAANALTITLNPTTLDFRDATLTSGTVNTRTVPAAISVVVSSGSTLGTVSAVENRLAVLAIDNAGTVELAVVNTSGTINLNEAGVISTTAEGGAGAADSATVIYSTTARTNVSYRVVGFVESTQATAGTWVTAPSKIQGIGGQSSISTALNANGTAPMYACRAWINFNGTGTVAIRGSGNISSITDNGTGDYTLNFTNALSDENYAWCGSGYVTGFAASLTGNTTTYTKTTSALRINTTIQNGSNATVVTDLTDVYVSVFR